MADSQDIINAIEQCAMHLPSGTNVVIRFDKEATDIHWNAFRDHIGNGLTTLKNRGISVELIPNG